MSTSNPQSTLLNVDLRQYAKKIPASEDRPLFDETVAAAMAGALRAAYVMIWLSCAESLKRRFREAKTRDNAAGKIVGEIDKLEGQHKSVDKFLLGSVVIFTVTPAKAGIQRPLAANAYLPATGFWVPAFAGMTETDAWRPIFLN